MKRRISDRGGGDFYRGMVDQGRAIAADSAWGRTPNKNRPPGGGLLLLTNYYYYYYYYGERAGGPICAGETGLGGKTS